MDSSATSSLAIHRIDVTGFIQFFNEPHIDVIFGVSAFGRRDALREVVKDGLESFESRIGLRLNKALEQLISVFELLFVFDLHAF